MKTMKTVKTAESWRNEGAAWLIKGNLGKAQACYEEALEVDENDHISLASLAEILSEKKNPVAAGYYMQAILLAPDNIKYKERFISVIGNTVFNQSNAYVENTLIECFKTPGLDCSGVALTWHSLLKYSGLLKASPHDLQAPFFLLGLKKFVVCDMGFEEFLTGLRKQLLEKNDASLLPLAEALSHYCFATNHIFYTLPEEEKIIEALRQKLESGKADEFSVAIYACYAPLYALKNYTQIEKQYAGSQAIADLVRAQIGEYVELQKIRSSITAITAIEKGISEGVRAQYEEFPYPRWTSIHKGFVSDPELQKFKGKKIKLLVAGCGTGHDPAQFALALPDADILAVDLSTSSLSYAIYRTKQLGITNITFRQADILKLSELNDKFDIIVSGGVLHHMEDPEKGFKSIAGLLKPGGLMWIGLYSEKARKPIVIGREAIRKGGYPATAEGMRAFRKKSPELLPEDCLKSLLTTSDYFCMNGYRDLLFHVQEQRFDIPRIEKMLSDNGIEFLSFSLPQEVMTLYDKTYRNREKNALKNWDAFETAYPGIFALMYQFWCKKAL